MEYEKKVIDIFSKVFDSESITIHSTKNDIESWDSIGHLRLIMYLEAEFNIKFKTNEVERISSVKVALDMINSLLK